MILSITTLVIFAITTFLVFKNIFSLFIQVHGLSFSNGTSVTERRASFAMPFYAVLDAFDFLFALGVSVPLGNFTQTKRTQISITDTYVSSF